MKFEGKFQRFSNKGSKVFVEPDVNFSI